MTMVRLSMELVFRTGKAERPLSPGAVIQIGELLEFWPAAFGQKESFDNSKYC